MQVVRRGLILDLSERQSQWNFLMDQMEATNEREGGVGGRRGDRDRERIQLGSHHLGVGLKP